MNCSTLGLPVHHQLLEGTGALPGPARNNIGGQEAKGNGAVTRRAGEARRTRAQPQGSEDRTDKAPMECCHVGPRGKDTAEAQNRQWR